jgi:DNA polymerase-3 subunit gamma/tau
MLTEHAFNALLKTLEEPPAHVKFILATTAPDKVPVTIQSRCLCFGFRLLTREEIVAHLEKQLAGEGRAVPRKVLEDVARAAEGSLRDSLSLLEQVVTFGGENPGENAAREVLHLVRSDTLIAFLEGIAVGDAAAVLRVVDELSQQGHDMRRFLQELIEWLRGMMLLSISGTLSDLIPLTVEERERLAILAVRFGRGRVQGLIEAAMEGEREIRQAASPRYAMEMVALRMLYTADIEAVGALLERFEALEARLGSAPAPRPAAEAGPSGSVTRPAPGGLSPSTPSAAAAPSIQPAEPPRLSPSLELTPDEPSSPPPAVGTGDWKGFVERLKKRRSTLCAYVEHGRLVEQDAHSITLGFTSGNRLFMEMSQGADGQAVLNEVAAEVFGPGTRVRMRVLEETEAPTAAKAATDLDRKKRSEAKHNPLVREVLDVIGGKVVDIKVLNTLREGEEPSP